MSQFSQAESPDTHHSDKKPRSLAYKIFIQSFIVMFGLGIAGVLTLAFAVIMAYPNLPELNAITSYKPKMPMRIFTADGVMIAEFGEERRNMVPIKEIPDVMKKAVLAIEDDRFYEHHGLDYVGIARALINNATSANKQGASTITQQVARNFFLSNEQTFKRKVYEALLAWKIEQNLSKDQILELYMNQIFLGQRAHGFSAAAQAYFGKDLKDITVAEAAMLAGLPKAPSANNPIVNPKRAKRRQNYILERMMELKYITKEQYDTAMKEELQYVKNNDKKTEFHSHAEYVAELARQLVYEQFKDDAYSEGLDVYTTILSEEQETAYKALRKGILDYETRHGYRGPEAIIELPNAKEAADDAIEKELADHPDSDDILAAMVLEASTSKVQAVLANGEEITVSGSGLSLAANNLKNTTPANKRIQRGAVIRVSSETKGDTKIWRITQMPEVQAAFVAANTSDGAIRALVGGFDFSNNKFNHVTQAWRQPGSSFKPFIYSSSLEKGMSPHTIINDSPISFPSGSTGGQAWEPKNYDGKYAGPITMRRGLTFSKNMISIRILDQVGAKYGQEYAMRFGFTPEKNPPYLTLALGAGGVTPLQMAGAYAVFANGGYKINPFIVAKITDRNGKVLVVTKPDLAGDEKNRVIDERNAFLMDSMMKDVVKHGTATRALSLKRPDIAGKTGTTNDAMDAWFAGYQEKIVGIAWMGYDNPKSLGSRETGGGVSLPIWIGYMQKALKGFPVTERTIPKGIVQAGNDFYYIENPPMASHNQGSNDINTEEVIIE